MSSGSTNFYNVGLGLTCLEYLKMNCEATFMWVYSKAGFQPRMTIVTIHGL